jgi:hypothetical protein
LVILIFYATIPPPPWHSLTARVAQFSININVQAPFSGYHFVSGFTQKTYGNSDSRFLACIQLGYLHPADGSVIHFDAIRGFSRQCIVENHNNPLGIRLLHDIGTECSRGADNHPFKRTVDNMQDLGAVQGNSRQGVESIGRNRRSLLFGLPGLYGLPRFPTASGKGKRDQEKGQTLRQTDTKI